MTEPNLISLTVRGLKPERYEQWRKAWDDPDDPNRPPLRHTGRPVAGEPWRTGH